MAIGQFLGIMFLSRDVTVKSHRTLGEDGRHLKMKVTLDGSAGVWDAIAFRQGHAASELPERVDLVYHFEANEWKGLVTPQLNVQDIRPATGA